MSQLNLFDDAPDPRALARAGDPATSHQAAVEVAPSVAQVQAWAAACVREHPGLTARELAAIHCPTDPRRIGRRLNECERLGLVRRGPARVCTVSGRQAETWYPPTPAPSKED